ncbi:hypothetical protein CEUSTIGMA_g4459.t1 [Chlamydomonas eustigma]|uniref:Prolyl endopeptidase-like n=1 Tax=Chlamydomonas eustigma TaxID=1157962 RepID=A0A250X291_9CHLO|nr:hypothetical protein CEUSTIGMA_g4459.t1 [Chlamydomonas eustigma]|eukprot:GAX77012.1 hypothetical protein CEUSTIGMA_g4459.t1 [Chlamydomonas eustigma]
MSKPPVACKVPYVHEGPFGENREDPYHWLRDDERSNPAVLSYLEEENRYAEGMLQDVIAPPEVLEDLLDDLARRAPEWEVSEAWLGGPILLPPHTSSSVKAVTTPGIHNTPISSSEIQSPGCVEAAEYARDLPHMHWWYHKQRGPGQDYWCLIRSTISLPPVHDYADVAASPHYGGSANIKNNKSSSLLETTALCTPVVSSRPGGQEAEVAEASTGPGPPADNLIQNLVNNNDAVLLLPVQLTVKCCPRCAPYSRHLISRPSHNYAVGGGRVSRIDEASELSHQHQGDESLLQMSAAAPSLTNEKLDDGINTVSRGGADIEPDDQLEVVDDSPECSSSGCRPQIIEPDDQLEVVDDSPECSSSGCRPQIIEPDDQLEVVDDSPECSSSGCRPQIIEPDDQLEVVDDSPECSSSGCRPQITTVVVFNENLEAEGLEYFDVGCTEVSPDGHFVAVTVDTVGNEEFELRVRCLRLQSAPAHNPAVGSSSSSSVMVCFADTLTPYSFFSVGNEAGEEMATGEATRQDEVIQDMEKEAERYNASSSSLPSTHGGETTASRVTSTTSTATCWHKRLGCSSLVWGSIAGTIILAHDEKQEGTLCTSVAAKQPPAKQATLEAPQTASATTSTLYMLGLPTHGSSLGQTVICLELSHSACCNSSCAAHACFTNSSVAGKAAADAGRGNEPSLLCGTAKVGPEMAHPLHRQTDSSACRAHIIYEEPDAKAEVNLSKSGDGRYIVVESKREEGTVILLLPSTFRPSLGGAPVWRSLFINSDHVDYLRGDLWGDYYIMVCDSDAHPDGFVAAARVKPTLLPWPAAVSQYLELSVNIHGCNNTVSDQSSSEVSISSSTFGEAFEKKEVLSAGGSIRSSSKSLEENPADLLTRRPDSDHNVKGEGRSSEDDLRQRHGCPLDTAAAAGAKRKRGDFYQPQQHHRQHEDFHIVEGTSSPPPLDQAGTSAGRDVEAGRVDERFATSDSTCVLQYARCNTSGLGSHPMSAEGSAAGSADYQPLVWTAPPSDKTMASKDTITRLRTEIMMLAEIRDIVVSGDFLAVSYVHMLRAQVAVYKIHDPASRPCLSSQHTVNLSDYFGGLRAENVAHSVQEDGWMPPSAIDLHLTFLRLVTLEPEVDVSSVSVHVISDIDISSLDHFPGLLRITYSSSTVPQTTLDICLECGAELMRQVEEVSGGFRTSDYKSELLWTCSSSQDNDDDSGSSALVPVSISYRKDKMTWDGSNMCVLHGYGAYGSRALLPHFNRMDLPLMDRGVVLASAYVRGGGELGSAWHLSGKLLRKKNTVFDFLAAANLLCSPLAFSDDSILEGSSIVCSDWKSKKQDFLSSSQLELEEARRMSIVTRQVSSHHKLAAWGRSAGGITVAGAINKAPHTFKAAILDVAFLDVLSTMSDPSLPLVLKERKEWGDPLRSNQVWQYISSYSPYDNLARINDPESAHGNAMSPNEDGQLCSAPHFPHFLFTSSLNDPRVSYHEPAKYVAMLRSLIASSKAGKKADAEEENTSVVHCSESPIKDPVVLLLTAMSGGHGSASGASNRLMERAQKIGFLLWALNTERTCA